MANLPTFILETALTQRASRAFMIGLPIASAGLWMAVLAPALVVLAIKIAEITTPDTRAVAYSLVAGVGALIALLANRSSAASVTAPPHDSACANPGSSAGPSSDS